MHYSNGANSRTRTIERHRVYLHLKIANAGLTHQEPLSSRTPTAMASGASGKGYRRHARECVLVESDDVLVGGEHLVITWPLQLVDRLG